jgi:TorA maturation chaperone TorD
VAIDESVEILLTWRMAVYRILQNLLGNEPGIEAMTQLRPGSAGDVLALFDADEGGYGTAVSELLRAVEGGLGDKEAFAERLSGDFTRLFVGPGKMEADPWESLHTGKENVLFQPGTLEVRKAYVAQGFIPHGYPYVADDHIALELDFMAALAKRMQDAYQSADPEQIDAALGASRDFLDRHLLVWVPSFVERLLQARHSQFYGKVGVVLREFLPIDRTLLDELEQALTENP